MNDLLAAMIEHNQLSTADAQLIQNLVDREEPVSIQSEEDVLRWLADEYSLSFHSLEGITADRQLLSQFPARILLKEEMLPLKR
ncbi:type II/IV secretion system protein, partial [bacterium]|nr:type II/IV secretion system protein [bacterium]